MKTMTQQANLQALCAEQLTELRGMFERILCVARSSDKPAIGNIQLADRLIDAVVSWSENLVAQPEPEGPTDIRDLLYRLADYIDNLHGIDPEDPLDIESDLSVEARTAAAALARSGFEVPSVKKIAEIIYNEAMRGCANESIYPRWDDLEDCLLLQCALAAASAVIDHWSDR